MAFKRKRRPRVVWLPVLGTNYSTDSEDDSWGNGIADTIEVSGTTGKIVTQVQAVTFDYSDEASFEMGTYERSLHTLVTGNAYRLRRIVGKFFCSAVPVNNALAALPSIEVAAGFMVNRTDPSGNLLLSAADQEEAGPLAQDGAEDPWIWRRKWLLTAMPKAAAFAATSIANIASLNTLLGFQGQFPQTNVEYGSVADGPHIDQKTARVISSQERLYFWVQSRCVNPLSTVNNATLLWSLDLRLLASLRSNQGNRRNASR